MCIVRQFYPKYSKMWVLIMVPLVLIYSANQCSSQGYSWKVFTWKGSGGLGGQTVQWSTFPWVWGIPVSLPWQHREFLCRSSWGTLASVAFMLLALCSSSTVLVSSRSETKTKVQNTYRLFPTCQYFNNNNSNNNKVLMRWC